MADITRKAADLLLSHRWKLWFWGDSIGLEGLLDATEITGDGFYAGFVHGLLKGWIARRDRRSQFDYTAPGVALLRAYERTRHETLLEAALEHASYLEAFRRTGAGVSVRYEDAAIELPPELPRDHQDFRPDPALSRARRDGGPCVFVDTVHFDGPFFSRLFHLTGEDRFRARAVAEVQGSIDLLADRASGLFHHFWSERSGKPNGVLWGRGNGWGMLGVLHTLEHLPPDDPAALRILEVFRRQAAAMAALQDPSGDWHTVLDDPGSYLEASVAAFVVDGFSTALRRGWLDPDMAEVVDLAFHALLQHVEPGGKLAGVSFETFPSMEPTHYRRMPRGAVVPWGQGPLITAIRSYQLWKEGQDP